MKVAVEVHDSNTAIGISWDWIARQQMLFVFYRSCTVAYGWMYDVSEVTMAARFAPEGSQPGMQIVDLAHSDIYAF